MRIWLLAATALVLSAPAAADVKAGVDAWGRGDYRQAVEQWRGPAISGDADAQFNLGQAYKLGRGVPVDPTLAESWFRKAALQGHVQGQDSYALALFQADRRKEALPWLEKSAARGEPRTQLVLGTMLFNGDDVPRDYPRAYALMTRAAAAGLPSAAQTLAQMDGFISPADRQRGTALAQQYAAQTMARPAPPAGSGAMQVADLPPSRVEVPVAQPTARAPARGKPPRATPAIKPAPVVAKPAPPASARSADKPAPARLADKPAPARGGWKVQLGAFRDRGNAEALWRTVRGKLANAAPAYVAGGGVTRLQATGFASKAEAQRACTASGVGCVVVAP